jgi:hypothetical protein
LHSPKIFRKIAPLITLAILCSLVPAARVSALSAVPPVSSHAAALSLKAYGIVDDRTEDELRLDQPITRAEVAKILGAALNLRNEAERQQSAVPFPDTAGHWAAGWIAVARQRGLFLGREDGRFYPQAQVTYAEAVTALLRLTGYGKDAGANWPWGAVLKAADLGMIPADLSLGGRWDEPATRGDIFRLTAMAIGRIPQNGQEQTLAQALYDTAPPDLTLTGFPAVTGGAGVTVTGTAVGAVTVLVGGQEAYLEPGGAFSADLSLTAGANQIPVLAVDGAGNVARTSAQIQVEPLTNVRIDPPVLETTVGQSVTPAVLRYGPSGGASPASNVTWEYDTTALSRDAATGGFTALRPGEYVLRATVEGVEATARLVAAGEPARLDLQVDQPVLVARGLPTGVTVRILDDRGRLNTAGSYNLQLSITPSGAASLDQPSVTTAGGVARVYLAPGTAPGGFGIQATMMGQRTLQSPLVPLTVELRRLSAIRLETDPANVSPGFRGPVSVKATAVDQSGSPYPVREDLTVKLTSSNPKVISLTTAQAVIRSGASSSDAGGTNGTASALGGTGLAVVTGTASGLPVVSARINAAQAGSLARLGISVVREVAMADGLSAALVAVSRLDAAGNVATGDRSTVVLVPSSQSVTVAPVQDSGGVVLFAVRAATPGRALVTAGIPGRPELNSQPAAVAFLQSMTTVRPVLKAASTMAAAGSSTVAYVALEGYDGTAAINPGPALQFSLQADGASVSATDLVIPAGATRSKDVTVSIPRTATMVNLSGAMVGGGSLLPAIISVVPAAPVVVPQAPAGLNLIAVPSQSGRSPMAGEDVRFVVRAQDGSDLEPGSYAFGLKVRLNGVELQELPPTLQVSIGNGSFPYIIGRTTKGEAEVWVRYTGTGTISLEPVPLGATAVTYDQWGAKAPGEATTGFTPVAGEVTYTPGPLDHMDIRVSPNLGNSLEGAIKAAPGRFATVRLAAADAFGNPTGSGCVATLSQVRSSQGSSMMLRSGAADVTEQMLSPGADGYAEFSVVQLSDHEGSSEWAPFMVCGSTPLTVKQNVVVTATVQSAPIPSIEFAGGDISGETGVRAADSALTLRIAQMANGPDAAELLVYDGATMIGRFGPVRPTAADPALRTVMVPKALLGNPQGLLDLRVRLHTASDVSEESYQRYLYLTPLP